MPPSVSRVERFGAVASTQDIVSAWLEAGQDEICVAVADVQTAGRGRLERAWQADAGRALLVSAGFRPTGLAPRHAWRLPAVVSLAMLEAARSLLADDADALALKWPNDIVAIHAGSPRKIAGVLGTGIPAGDSTATAVVGIGVNVTWPRREFPPGLAETMWSLSEANGGRDVERELLLSTWLARLAEGYAALAGGRFDSRTWAAAQVTTGAEVEVDTGHGRLAGLAVGVDSDSGALLLEVGEEQTALAIPVGDVLRCRLATPAVGGMPS